MTPTLAQQIHRAAVRHIPTPDDQVEADQPDLCRVAGGYMIAVWFRPSLASPVSAHVEVWRGGDEVDMLDLDPSVAVDAFHHTALYSTAYAAEVGP